MSAYVREGEAKRLTGKSHTTIQRSGKTGKVSFKKDDEGKRVYSVVDLEKVFGFVEPLEQGSNDDVRDSSNLHELEKKLFEQQIEALNARASALERERDDWKEQASKWEQQAQSATRLLTHEQEKSTKAEAPKKGLLARIFG